MATETNALESILARISIQYLHTVVESPSGYKSSYSEYGEGNPLDATHLGTSIKIVTTDPKTSKHLFKEN